MDNMVQTIHYGPYEPPHPWGDRPDDLPISAAAWDAAKPPQSASQTAVIKALFEAVKHLEEKVQTISDQAP
ncbi:hypothetical protein [Mycolicibacterium sp. 624]|uniref:hypothetical protein n=1 Tax=Mycolicibacterium sp. 624 TaxID=3156314 RepID=UPI0033910CBE